MYVGILARYIFHRPPDIQQYCMCLFVSILSSQRPRNCLLMLMVVLGVLVDAKADAQRPNPCASYKTIVTTF